MRNPLDKRIKEIRDLINISRKQDALQQDNALWLMLCTCMDTIQDTEVALESFLIENTDDSQRGKNHLYMYGALQALFVQQDAVDNLHEALDMRYTMDSSIKEIRNIRTDAAGHPTNRGNKKSFNFIYFGSTHAHGFNLMTVYPRKSNDGRLDSEHVDINVADLIATQCNIFMEVLDNVIEALKEEEVEHRKKFSDKKLAGVFWDTTYPFEKIWDAVLHPDSAHVSLVDSYVKQISECIKAFKDGLKERGEPAYHISDIYEHLEYSLRHINAYFDKGNKTHIQKEDTYIFVSFIQQQVDILREFAQHLDDEYSQ